LVSAQAYTAEEHRLKRFMLPEWIEIIPVSRPETVQAQVVIPGSKSLTNRALILAAQAEGPVTLRGALWSEDTQVMTACLLALGFAVEVEADPEERGNRTIRVCGLGGRIPRAGTPEAPLDLFVGNAGTAARFLAALVCLGHGSYRLHGVSRMHERPQAALLQGLRDLGYRVETPNDFLPAIIHGTGPRPGARACVSVDESSQFASALILSQSRGGWEISVSGANDDELPYVEMTRRLIESFPWSGGEYQIEPDASSASYFWGAEWLLGRAGARVEVVAAPSSGLQADQAFQAFTRTPGVFPPVLSRTTDLADSIMTAIALAPFAEGPTRFIELGRLRVQECERVAALRSELTKCGAQIVEEGDTLTVTPGPLHGADIHTYHDHRMAMCLALVGLRVPGIRLHDPSCVRKTFPGFFQKLAAAVPLGLGVEVRDGLTGEMVPSFTV
jgi:3-phosphoshikimate 1-carboxyvinyltransferase